MTLLETVLTLALCLSVAGQVYLYRRYRAARKAPAPTYDAQELLHAISRGKAVLKIEVIDPTYLFKWTPRGG